MKKMNRNLGLFAGAALLSSGSAMAQTTASQRDPAKPAAAAAADSEDIVVTAQRRSERLQDVPIAVSAFTTADLETRQIHNTLDLVNYVPNLIGHNNTALGTANTYSLRGLANTESISTFDPPVGTYVDDVYISRQGANNFSFFDVERIEVLRGPQGTLFGRNTTGGAISVIMRKPSDHITGYAEAGYGRYNRFEARGSIDLPISDRLLTKFSGYNVTSDGYVNNRVTGEKLNGEKSYGLRGAVRALVSDAVTWDISADYINSQATNLPNFRDRATGERVTFTPLRSDVPLGAALVSPELADNTLNNTAETYSITSNIEVALGGVTINAITGYRHLYQEFLTDSFAGLNSGSVVFDGINFVSGNRGTSTPLANDSYHRQFSQEVKLTGDAFGGFATYVGGIYYIKETNRTNFANISVPLVGNPSVSGDRTVFNDTEAYAGYLQADFHLTSALTATAGIRYTDEHKDIQYVPNASPLPRSAPINQAFTTQDVINRGIPVVLNARLWTPRFAVNYKITPDVMVFASATRGFKSGGWNARAYYAAVATAFTEETIWSYEGGIRSEFLDRRVRVNLTGFLYTDFDEQLPGGGLNPITNTITYLTRNVADQRNYGLEGEITVNPIGALNLFWNFGYQKASYRNPNAITVQQQANCRAGIIANNCNAGIVTPAGDLAVPTRAPEFTSTLGISYGLELGGGLTLLPSGNWNHISGNWVATSNEPRGFQPAHDLFNAGVTLRSISGWSLGVECSNCFNDTYRTSFLIYPYLNSPGTWQVRARFNF